jgi:hypothetical protein
MREQGMSRKTGIKKPSPPEAARAFVGREVELNKGLLRKI